METVGNRQPSAPGARPDRGCLLDPGREKQGLPRRVGARRAGGPRTGEWGTVMPITLLASTFSRRDAIAAMARAFDVTPGKRWPSPTSSSSAPQRGPGAGRTRDRPGHRDGLRAHAHQGRTAGPRHQWGPSLHHHRTAGRRTADRDDGHRVDRCGPWPGPPGGCRPGPRSIIPTSTTNKLQGVRKLLTSGNGCDLVIGQAGTGKSTMLRAARLGWEAGGHEGHRGGRGGQDGGRPRGRHRHPELVPGPDPGRPEGVGGLTNNHVIVVDEASLVGTRALDELWSRVEPRAKVVLVGDNRQLSSIDAGGALRTLARELGPTWSPSPPTGARPEPTSTGSVRPWRTSETARSGPRRPGLHGPRPDYPGPDIDEARHRLIDDWWAVHHDHTDGHHGRAPGRRGHPQRAGPGPPTGRRRAGSGVRGWGRRHSASATG